MAWFCIRWAVLASVRFFSQVPPPPHLTSDGDEKFWVPRPIKNLKPLPYPILHWPVTPIPHFFCLTVFCLTVPLDSYSVSSANFHYRTFTVNMSVILCSCDYQYVKSWFPKPLTSTPTCYSFAAQPQVTAKKPIFNTKFTANGKC